VYERRVTRVHKPFSSSENSVNRSQTETSHS